MSNYNYVEDRIDMNVIVRQKQYLQHTIKEISESLKLNKNTLVKNRINLIFNTTLFDESKLKTIIESESVEVFFNLGTLLLRAFEKSANNLKPEYQKLLFRFLDFARTNLLLQKIYKDGKGTDWFELILAIIKKINFTSGQLFYQRVERHGKKTLFKVIKNQTIIEYSWYQIKEKVDAIARSLFAFAPQKILLEPVAILSENSLEMVCIDLACLSTGIINVLIPANSVPAQVEYILRHSGARTLFVSNENQLSKVLKFRSHLNTLQHIVIIESLNAVNDDSIIPFNEFIQRGKNVSLEKVQKAIEEVKVDNLATIMYTSGTTEAPKGIMFSHLNIVSKRFARAIALPEIGEHDTFLCYLPLFHTFGRYFEMLGCIFWGSIYVFVENPKIKTMINTMERVKPTILISIPKKWIQLYKKIKEKVDVEVASWSEIQEQVSRITGGRLKWGLSAAGYLEPDIFRFFQNHGIELMSGFGMTEATGGITMTPPYHYKDNSVGKALPGIAIRLSEDGEMMIKGPYVMMGYLYSESTSFKDGWFYTGDIFTKDKEGYYWILDRKKEIYKNIKGETIAPQKIENLFRDFESIKRVFLVGDHREYNTLLLYPNYKYNQINLTKMSHEKLREFFNSLIVSVNRFLAPYERIVNFTIIDRDFDAKKGELTSKGTFKRKAVENNFHEVIEKMYSKDYATLMVNNVEVRIPNWFLREKGLTADDLILENSSIVCKPTKMKLKIKTSPKEPRRLRVGTFWYVTPHEFFDFNEIINNPILWIGNIELVRFVGEDIFRWSHVGEPLNSEIKITNSALQPKYNKSIFTRLNQIIEQQEKSLQGIHLSAFVIYTLNESSALIAIQYLESIMKKNPGGLSNIAKFILNRTAELQNNYIKRRAFQALIMNEENETIKPIFEQFLKSDVDFLDKKTIRMICEKDLSKNQMQDIFSILTDYFTHDCRHDAKSAKKSFLSLFDFITSYGILHPIWYKSIRSELIKWSLFELDKEVSQRAKTCFDKLLSGFRSWVEPNQLIAVDPETSREYRWEDVIEFEKGIDHGDRNKILGAIEKKPIIREAIFLFTEGILLQLQDIPIKGIWISFLGSLHGKSVYRVSVQTRHLGSFDLAINVNKSLTEQEVSSEITWLIRAGATQDDEPLVEDFGGYWPEYDLWTEEFIPGETVEKFLKRLDLHQEKEWVARMQLLWPYLVWSSLSAYVDFWNRTGRHLEIADPTPANVIVPSHDYHVGSRIVSISERKPFESISNMIISFRHNFINPVELKYKKLKGYCSWHVIFSSFLEILGGKEGTQILEKVLDSFDNKKLEGELSELHDKLITFIKAVHTKGFLPKRLHFAIQRFRRWLELNPEATPQARMQTLQELYTTYTLENLEKDYPGTRIQFFRDTVFANSHKELIKGLSQILNIIRESKISDDNVLEKISDLQNQIKFNPNEEFYLARMTYPHLGPMDSAELISLTTDGVQKTDLVVFIEDYDGNLLSIRHPATPKEIARLHRLFTVAKLPVEFRPEHQYLVVLDERGQVISGLFYRTTGANSAHMEKIVVAERHRKKGVSDALMKEFFDRLRNKGFKIVTVGFLRPEYFYKFGFKIDYRYGGLVKKLEPEIRKEFTNEIVERI